MKMLKEEPPSQWKYTEMRRVNMGQRRLIGRGQVTIQDYTDSKTLLAYIGSTLQRQVIYDPDGKQYNPDYGVTPIELVSELYIAGDTDNKIGEAKSITWYAQENSMGDLVEIVDDATYATSGDSLLITSNVLKDRNSMSYQAKIVFPIEDSEGKQEDMVVIASIELVKLSSGAKGVDGEDGEDALLSVLNLPDGDTIRNHENTLRIEVNLYKGALRVTPTTIRWYQLSPNAEGDNFSGKGWRRLGTTTASLKVAPEMFSGTGTYLSIVTYEGTHYRNTTTVRDIVDTTVSIIGPSTFKNGKGTITLTAKVYSVGEEVDADGKDYLYEWSSYDTSGNFVEGFEKTGKTISIGADEVDNIVSLQCMVSMKPTT